MWISNASSRLAKGDETPCPLRLIGESISSRGPSSSQASIDHLLNILNNLNSTFSVEQTRLA